MANEVTFKIKIDDNGGFKKVTMDAEELGKAVRSVQDEAEKTRRSIISWAEASQAFDVMRNAISDLQSVTADLTQAYQIQLVAETQLETIMRQRMGATDDMIQSVKDLCSAQQALGVIGDEVQLSGAQQMATFLKDKQSLDVLIPAMNNLVAQQNGLNATNQDAVSIGNMMGKAMQGQVEVLQRVGITFDENQKKVLQYGNESERAAMLAQVITDNVGNMNAELAKTDAGKQKQLENNLGDVKEQIGQIMQRYSQLITVLAQSTVAVTGLTRLYTTVRSVASALGLTRVAGVAWNATSVRMNALTITCSASMRGAAVSAKTLKLALQGLMIATGVGVAIAALSEVISMLISTNEDAADSAVKMAEAQQSAADNVKSAYDNTLQQTYSALMAKYEQLKQSWLSMKTEHEKTEWLSKNKGAFDELRIKVNDISDAENVFTKNTQKVAEAFERRAQAAAYAAQLVELYKQQLDLKNRKANVDKTIYDTTQKYNHSQSVSNQDNPYAVENTQRQANIAAIASDMKHGGDGNLKKLDEQLDATNAKIKETKDALKSLGGNEPLDLGSGGTGGGGHSGITTTPGTTTTTDQKDDPLQGSIDWYNKRISELNKELAATAESSTRKNLQTTIEGLQRELGMLKVEAGIDIMPKIEVKKDKNIFQKIDEQMADWVKNHQQIEIEVKVKGEGFKKSMESIKNGWGSIQGVGNGIQGITDALQNNKNAWQAISGVINGFISIAEGIEGIVSLVNTLTASTAAHTTATTTDAAATAADTAASTTNTAAKSGEAIANATASGAKMPFPANLVAIAAGVAAVVAALAMVSGAFAEGGIVGGNSISGDKLLARVNSGEMILNAAQQARLFALANGAAVNVQPGIALPQVSVQSSKLQGLLAGDNNPRQIDLRMKVRGRDLVMAAANETRSNRRRSNIKI